MRIFFEETLKLLETTAAIGISRVSGPKGRRDTHHDSISEDPLASLNFRIWASDEMQTSFGKIVLYF